MLEALSGEESGELISWAARIAYDVPEVLYHTIQSRAEGNPFFVEEIVRMLIDQGTLVREDGSWRVSEQITRWPWASWRARPRRPMIR